LAGYDASDSVILIVAADVADIALINQLETRAVVSQLGASWAGPWAG